MEGVVSDRVAQRRKPSCARATRRDQLTAWRVASPRAAADGQIGASASTELIGTKTKLQSTGVEVPGVPVIVTSLAVDATMLEAKLTAPGPWSSDSSVISRPRGCAGGVHQRAQVGDCD